MNEDTICGPETASEEKASGRITLSLGREKEAIQTLDMAVGKLEKALEIVMRPESEGQSEKNPELPRACSTLADEIERSAKNVEGSVKRIIKILKRLDI